MNIWSDFPCTSLHLFKGGENDFFIDDGVINIRSLHGNTFFHPMGMIKVVTPAADQQLDCYELLFI